tara:strand:+ start:53 stop:424 length:372 start_codon:yes stop_codon:yes gene_type:complete
MALQGKFFWKGIEIEQSYIAMQSVNCSVNYETERVLDSPEELNDDGTIKKRAVYKDVINKKLKGSYVAHIYKDKQAKDSNPNEIIDIINGVYTPKHNTTAKNDVAQAYAALKALDAYKDLADA